MLTYYRIGEITATIILHFLCFLLCSRCLPVHWLVKDETDRVAPLHTDDTVIIDDSR